MPANFTGMKNTNKILTAGMGIMVLTILHHLYGAMIYDAPFRLHVVYFAVPVILLLWLTHWLYRRYGATAGGKAALIAFLLITIVVPVALIGLYEGGYNHVVKNVAYFGGASMQTMKRLYPSDLYEMPDDFIFESSGVLQFAAAIYAIGTLLPLRNKSSG